MATSHPLEHLQSSVSRPGGPVAKACGDARAYLEHVCVTVMCVLDYDRVAPGQCVRDAVLATVAQCLVT